MSEFVIRTDACPEQTRDSLENQSNASEGNHASTRAWSSRESTSASLETPTEAASSQHGECVAYCHRGGGSLSYEPDITSRSTPLTRVLPTPLSTSDAAGLGESVDLMV